MITFAQGLRLVADYARERVTAQARAVAPIVLYLVLFQLLVLGVPIADALVVAAGLALVVLGLAFFMEGLMLGLMPLGEVIGLRLPQRSRLPVILAFSFLLGVGATFAEPAIGVLRAAGASVRPWEAPLLFLLLDSYPRALVWAVGVGVGLAVLLGMMRFLFQWSLKPFIYLFTAAAVALTVWGWLDPNLVYLAGLAWDCGAVTTGPVTVPLVLALGIGVSRVVATGDSESQGFGVVTLASLLPVLAVLLLGAALAGRAPAPMSESAFFEPGNRAVALELLGGDEERLAGYALRYGSPAARGALFGGEEALLGRVRAYASDPGLRRRAFGDEARFNEWLALRADAGERRAAVEAHGDAVPQAAGVLATLAARLPDNALAAAQAILPLTLFLVLVLKWLLRFRVPRPDELVLGVAFALVGLGLFNLGIELGLARVGDQVGGKLPAAYSTVSLPEERQVIEGFDRALVQRALGPDGKPLEFFFARRGDAIRPLPFDPQRYEPDSGRYLHVPHLGPLFGSNGSGHALGLALALLFAFLTGYAATLAEPALNALGITVERVTGGSFRKGLLMQTVAVGVGIGMLLGVVKVVWNLPLAWLLVPTYLLLLPLTRASSEELTNIAWDGAGVTTGPITVPLVLALGLGIGAQAGVVEGFGVLAMASAWPILTVLSVGLYVTWRHRRELALEAAAPEPAVALEDQEA